MTPYGYVTVRSYVHVWNSECNHLLVVARLSCGLAHTQDSQAGSTWRCQPVYDGLNMSVWAQWDTWLGASKHRSYTRVGQVGAVGEEGRVPPYPLPPSPTR